MVTRTTRELKDLMRQAELDRLRKQIDLGLDQARRAELLDGEEIFEKLLQRS